jgi:glycosyltransferase involved in cell wall biosynthesis
MRVTHILPKMNDGGGISNIFAEVSALSKYQFDVYTTIVSLESAISTKRMIQAKKSGIRLVVAPRWETLTKLVEDSDLLVITYWNHPLLSEFMVWWVSQTTQVPLIVSVRVNGLTLPQVVPNWVFKCASGVIYTHPKTLSVHIEESLPNFRQLSHPFIQLPDIEQNQARNLNGDFVAFYAGSLNRFKRLPNLFDLHDRLNTSGCRIEYWGAGEDSSTNERLKQLKVGVHKGFSNDIYSDFSKNHLLLNPQSPLSYGSYEKIRVECAWMGIPNLVIQDSYISDHVENGVNGLIAADEHDYIEKLNWLVNDRKAWKSLSDSTFEHIRKTYQLQNISESTMEFYREVCSAGSRSIDKVSLPKTTLSRVMSGMGKWAEQIESDPENLSDLELEYALHCEGGLIHYANMDGMDQDLKNLIERLFRVLEKRRSAGQRAD